MFEVCVRMSRVTGCPKLHSEAAQIWAVRVDAIVSKFQLNTRCTFSLVIAPTYSTRETILKLVTRQSRYFFFHFPLPPASNKAIPAAGPLN